MFSQGYLLNWPFSTTFWCLEEFYECASLGTTLMRSTDRVVQLGLFASLDPVSGPWELTLLNSTSMPRDEPIEPWCELWRLIAPTRTRRYKKSGYFERAWTQETTVQLHDHSSPHFWILRNTKQLASALVPRLNNAPKRNCKKGHLQQRFLRTFLLVNEDFEVHFIIQESHYLVVLLTLTSSLVSSGVACYVSSVHLINKKCDQRLRDVGYFSGITWSLSYFWP